MSAIKTFALCMLCMTILAGCYPCPEDDYISTIPMTNNPTVVPQKKQAALPSMEY